MNNHLSQDQLSMWILGRCTAEELKHGRECSQCRAELARFETPVAAFRSVMLEWSDWEIAPQIEEILPRLRRPKAILNTSWRWVALCTAVLLLTAIPIYRQVSLSPTVDVTAVENADALLMDAVSAHLSRTMPAPMEPIMALIPTQEAQPGETQ